MDGTILIFQRKSIEISKFEHKPNVDFFESDTNDFVYKSFKNIMF